MRSFLQPAFDFNNKSILVTGGTGSFGQKFIRTLVERYTPSRVVIYSRDELKQFEMAQVLTDKEYPFLRYFIGDVRDAERLEMAMTGIDYVVHAAALKHVPIAEYNPFECIHTNVIGAENVVRASIRSGVKKVIALSTDKAANPINLYGASKLASDKIFIAGNHLAGAHGTRFCIVRYGNVMGSRGSVVPFFMNLINKGTNHLPITHEEMTRFWVTLEQGINLVISSFALMRGGEIFVPKIPSMRIVDLAKSLAPKLELRVTGIRPGEKLHEIMITEDDAVNTLEFEDRYVVFPAFSGWDETPFATDGGKKVKDRFSYASDTNTEWLKDGDFHDMLRATGISI